MRYAVALAATLFLFACGAEDSGRTAGDDVVDAAQGAMDKAENVEQMLEDKKQDVDEAVDGVDD